MRFDNQCLPWLLAAGLSSVALTLVTADEIDFNRDIRPVLSNRCFVCHGPDEATLQSGLRLDQRSMAIAELESGSTAIVPGDPEASELIRRITSDDDSLRMPPAEFGNRLSPGEADLLTRWVRQGAEYALHWSYMPPERLQVPPAAAAHADWPQNAVDFFVLQRMLREGLIPSPPADRRALARRLFLDLTGLPPTVQEVEGFVADTDPRAWERLVDDVLLRPAFGEHWARQWLDLARYADSAGYADDPSRTIWGYRDWVIRAINDNMPFDQFTIEQLAGDLLPDATTDQLVATAFHRNTLTNNEGGTQDEEFRNVAVVDRVNTTLAVWMGTTMACAQCHSHKYDPISQEEYFRFFAILNNTEDADRRDEAPVQEVFTSEQLLLKDRLISEISELEAQIAAPGEAVGASQRRWEAALRQQPTWTQQLPRRIERTSELDAAIGDDGIILISEAADTDTYLVDLPLKSVSADAGGVQVAAVRLEVLPDPALPGGGSGHGGGNFVITELRAQLVPDVATPPSAQFIRIEIPGRQKILSLAEVQVYSRGSNIAADGTADQSSTDFDGPAHLAIDGNTNGDFQQKSVTHTAVSRNPWWELNLKSEQPIDRIVVWNRTDNNLHQRLADFTLTLLDAQRAVVWQQQVAEAPNPSAEWSLTGIREIPLLAAYADYHQPDFLPQEILDGKTEAENGWAVGGAADQPHALIVVPSGVIEAETPAALRIILEQKSPYPQHVLGKFRFGTTVERTAIERAQLPSLLLTILEKPETERDAEQQRNLSTYYREQIAEEFHQQRVRLAELREQLAALRPATSVPIMRELQENRRVTRLQYRGNYLDLGPEQTPGLPDMFQIPVSAESADAVDRLVMAKWLVDRRNPLTARVLANRYWEALFGRGIVVTSEEFGSQGELPTHPELLDWLAVEVMENNWDTKALLKLLVTSATWRQSSRVTEDTIARDRDNRWLARGPRVRLSAEMVRDQALFVSGLLSPGMYGEPVNPPQPSLGLTAAFGSSTDWKTSEGSNRYRRGLYTMWRRSNPYPSMATFDAPNREVCTIRRNHTNTPLQSLVTLNDPVYVEAAQVLARWAMQQPAGPENRLKMAFQRCVLRPPEEAELTAMIELYGDVSKQMAERPEEARQLVSGEVGEWPDGTDLAVAAAMTVAANVLLNLDEMFLKR